MLSKDHCELVYVGLDVKENGSPLKKEITKEVRCDLADLFSSNFYFERGREMRDSLRIVINSYYCDDISDDDGLLYHLRYVLYDGVKYSVENIMLHFMRNYKKDRFHRDLDLKKAL